MSPVFILKEDLTYVVSKNMTHLSLNHNLSWMAPQLIYKMLYKKKSSTLSVWGTWEDFFLDNTFYKTSAC